MTREINRAGGFIQLGVSDLERKRFCIFIPRGRGDKRGWMIMAKKLHQLVGALGRKPKNQEVRAMGKAIVGRSYVTVAKRPPWGNPNLIAVKAKREETLGFLQKLEHCVVVSWKASSGGEEDLESLGKLWAKSWGLRGNLGLAKLEKKDFCWNLKIWKRQDALFLQGIARWEDSRVGDECGGFITVDEQTKMMGELQWARILVKSRGEVRPSVLEIEVEEEVYALSLWPIVGPKETRRAGGLGLAGGPMGLKMKRVLISEVGLEADPSSREWAEDVGCLAKGPVSPKDQSSSKGPTSSMGCQKQSDLEGKTREGPISLAAQDSNNDPQEKGLSVEALHLQPVAVGELGVTKRSSDKARGMDGAFGTYDVQAVRNESEEKWEESSLAKFSHFLGFPTEGLEKEILNFLIKIRKRREKIHSKELLEKFKFERELKRLECSVNYEGGISRKARFRNVGNGAVWVFTGVYDPFSKVERDELWEEFGAIRGLWEDPWGENSPGMGAIISRLGQDWTGSLCPLAGLDCDKSSALQQVEFWDWKESERILTMEETELKKEAKENYKKWVLMEETHWRQFSREIWLKEGIETRVSSIAWQGPTIETIPWIELRSMGNGCQRSRKLGKELLMRFVNCFRRYGWKTDIGRLQFEQISQQEAENLERFFTEDEIHAALMEMNGDKAPGPDGFTMAFWQSC
ncbi:hypothetical protein CK203_090634 [Vitis vinifera]|uniref:DUF4283 domain-containing protein n=1 Tax=Vitis vinifera TaxID=29760 RepID=A0A438DW54_VITVI|nr:hypothetical protein CK203_090634 [Vitis vinifera]